MACCVVNMTICVIKVAFCIIKMTHCLIIIVTTANLTLLLCNSLRQY